MKHFLQETCSRENKKIKTPPIIFNSLFKQETFLPSSIADPAKAKLSQVFVERNPHIANWNSQILPLIQEYQQILKNKKEQEKKLIQLDVDYERMEDRFSKIFLEMQFNEAKKKEIIDGLKNLSPEDEQNKRMLERRLNEIELDYDAFTQRRRLVFLQSQEIGSKITVLKDNLKEMETRLLELTNEIQTFEEKLVKNAQLVKPQDCFEFLREAIDEPSEFAKNWPIICSIQPNLILCNRFVNNVNVLPLTLLNEIFAKTWDGCRGKGIHLTPDDDELAFELVSEMMGVFKDETARKMALISVLYKVFGQELVSYSSEKVGNQKGYKTDATIIKNDYYVFNIVVKNELQTSSGDPRMQNIGYYIHQPKFLDANKFELPCLLLEIQGPWLTLNAIMNVNYRVLHWPLFSCPLLYLDESHLESIAFCVASMKRAVAMLNDYYSKPLLPHAKEFVPFPLRKETDIVRQKRAVYIVGQNQRVVKFCRRYGKTVHEFCHSKGFAPRLLDIHILPDGWFQVEMEFIKGVPFKTNDESRDKLKRILQTLKSKNFVHGDFRDANVLMNENDDVFLIDFDWSGVANKDVYPSHLNSEIPWYPKIRKGDKLQLEHDAHLYHEYFEKVAQQTTPPVQESEK